MALGIKILRNATVLTIGDKISNLLLFFFFLYFARKFGIVPTGEYSFGFSFTYIFFVFADLGISTYLVREVARRNSRDRQLFLDCLVLKSIFIVIISCLAIGIVVLFLDDSSREKLLVLLCWGGYWIFFSIADVFTAELNGHQKMGRVALLGIWHKLICLIGGAGLIFLGYNYTVALLVFPVSSIIYLATSIFVSSSTLGWSRVKIRSYKDYRDLFKALLPFYSAFILLEILWSQDVIVLGFIHGDQSVGIYSCSLKIVSFILGVSTFIYISILPALSRLFVESREKLKAIAESILKYIYLLFMPVSFGLYVTADKSIDLLYSETFSESAIVLKIMCWIVVAGFAQALYSAVLTAIDRQKEKVFYIGINFIVSVPLNFILIYHFDFVGAAIAKLASTLAGLFFFVFLVYRYLGYLAFLKSGLKALIACLVMMAFVNFYQDLSIFYIIPVSVVIYLVCLVLQGSLQKREITFIKERIPGRIL